MKLRLQCSFALGVLFWNAGGAMPSMANVHDERPGLRSETRARATPAVESASDTNIGGRNSDTLSRNLFGGEDLFKGDPWWHEKLSENAIEGLGFSPLVSDRIAWHADYTDSYCYNPYYWFSTPDFVDRFKAARSLFPFLTKVHNDDLFSTDQVIAAQYRYMTGCLVGLHWAAEIYENKHSENVDPIGAAHNILGVAFHALQDFYSHSNWIDDESRRDSTFLDIPSCDLKNEYLFTGSYEEDGGIKSHGKFSIICSLTADGSLGSVLSFAMDLYCSDLNPFSDDDICNEYRDCDELDPTNVGGGSVLGIDIPDGVLYYAPAGINLDNTWQAEIGVQVRGIDLSGSEAFDIAKNLATRGSKRMLEEAERFMIAEGHQTFWNEVKMNLGSSPKEDQFENFNAFPLLFLGTGPYPVESTDDGYYLRVVIKTKDEFLAGTDADIKLIADGKEFDLDYMEGANPLIGYNDFEAGDETVYTLGPFPSLPSSIRIKNDAPDFGDILEALGNSIKNFFVDVFNVIKDIFTNDADYVGTNSFSLEPSELQAIAVGSSKAYSVNINGGSEGNYDVRFTVEHLSSSTDTQDVFRVTVTTLYCIEEASCDGFLCTSTSDEPFLLSALYSYGTPIKEQFHQSSKFSGVDSGDTRTVNHVFDLVYFERPLGAMVLNFQIWESDDEGAGGRSEIFDEFKGVEHEEVDGFFRTVGEAIAADWKLDWIKVYAFQRGKNAVGAGKVLDDGTDRWIEGGKSHTYSLNQGGFRRLTSLNFEPVALCQTVTREASTQCQATASGSEFDGGSTDPDCDALTFGANPNSPYELGKTSVTLTVEDVTGNTDTCSTWVLVEDTTPPIITGCSDSTVECSAPNGTPKTDLQLASFFSSVTASDNCPLDPITDTAPKLLPVGSDTTVIFNVKDSSENQASCTGVVTVRDTTPPLISGCSSTTVECSATNGTPKTDSQLSNFYGAVTTSDTCDSEPDLVDTSPSLFGVGQTTSVTFTSTDDFSNSAACDGAVTVQDTTPPAISGCFDVTVECSAQGGTPKLDSQLASFFSSVVYPDVCDASPDLIDDSIDFYDVATTKPVKFTATDNFSNSASCFGDITVEDTTAPVVSTLIDTITIWPPNNKYLTYDLFADYGASAADVCCGDDVNDFVFKITAMSSNEPDKKNAKTPSFESLSDTTFRVQAQRLGSGNGRVYTVDYDVTDCQGNVASSKIYVVVPKSQNDIEV